MIFYGANNMMNIYTAIKENRRLWLHIALKIYSSKKVCFMGELKYEYFRENRIRHITASCFLCEYSFNGTNLNCCVCPLYKYSCSCCDDKSYYAAFISTDSWKEQYKLALKIAYTPMKFLSEENKWMILSTF